MSNRVDELERKVKDLQAAVNGLTEELVESKERIRQLEDTVNVDDPSVRANPAGEPEAVDDDTSENEQESTANEAAEAAETAEEAETREQRFVDAEEHEAELEDSLGPEGSTDEEAKSEDAKDEETESEQSGSDIIVA